MKNRKMGAVLVAGVMACSIAASGMMAGCGKTIADFVMPEGGFNTEAPVTIKFYHTMGKDLRDVLDASLQDFKTLFPNITVDAQQVGGYEDVRNQISTEIGAASGDHPNLAYCYPDHVALFNQSNAVLALNDFLPGGAYSEMEIAHADGETSEKLGFTQEQKNSFIKGYWDEGFLYDDGEKMYTLPFSKSTEVLYYNKTFFDANKLTAPTTWEEMEATCKKIKEIAPTCTPLGYDSEANWFITMCEQYGSPYTSSDGEKYLFDNAKNREFVGTLKGWYDKGYFTTQELNKAYTSNLFKNQTSYMCIGSSAGALNQRPQKVDGKYPFEVGITSIPQVDPENPKVISQGPSICVFKHDDPQEVLASVLLAKYLTTDIAFQAQFSTASGYVPVITTVMENAVYKDNLDKADGRDNLAALAAKVCMEQEKAYYTSPAFVGSAKARDEVGALMQAVFAGTKSIDAAFTDAISECEYFAG